MITLETMKEKNGLFGAYVNGLIATNETADILGGRTEYLFKQDRIDEDERTQRIIESTAFKIMQTGEGSALIHALDEIRHETETAGVTYWELRNRVTITYYGYNNGNYIAYREANSLEQILEIVRAIVKMTGATVEVQALTQNHDFSISLRSITGKLIGGIAVRL